MNKIITSPALLKEYINHFNIPVKHLGIGSSNCELEEDGSGLSTIGEYFFMCLALVPKNQEDVFDKIVKKTEKEIKEEDDVLVMLSLHKIPKDSENYLLLCVSSDDAFINSVSKDLKKFNHLEWSDEFNIYGSGFYDNDGGLVQMDYELTLAVLRCQNFFTERPVASLVGEKICFTGFRDKELETLLVEKGAQIVPSVTKATTVLVAKEPGMGGSKEDKAESLEIPILSMFQLISQKMMPGSVVDNEDEF